MEPQIHAEREALTLGFRQGECIADALNAVLVFVIGQYTELRRYHFIKTFLLYSCPRGQLSNDVLGFLCDAVRKARGLHPFPDTTGSGITTFVNLTRAREVVIDEPTITF